MTLLVFSTAVANFVSAMVGRRWGGDVGLMLMAAFAILLGPAWLLWLV